MGSTGPATPLLTPFWWLPPYPESKALRDPICILTSALSSNSRASALAAPSARGSAAPLLTAPSPQAQAPLALTPLRSARPSVPVSAMSSSSDHIAFVHSLAEARPCLSLRCSASVPGLVPGVWGGFQNLPEEGMHESWFLKADLPRSAPFKQFGSDCFS